MNNYEDFKVDFTYISTGKPQSCGLYGKGVLVNNTIYGENKAHNKRKFLMRPNLIPKVTILFIHDYKQSQGNFIYLEISDMVDFIKSCGDAHQYAVGKYNAVQ